MAEMENRQGEEEVPPAAESASRPVRRK